MWIGALLALWFSRSLDCFTSNFSKAVCDTASYYRLLIGNHTLAFDWSYFWWPWSTLEGHFSLGCHFHLHFSNPWHAFASHGLPATAELLVFMFLLFILKHLVSHYWPPLCSAMRSIIVSVRLCLSVCLCVRRKRKIATSFSSFDKNWGDFWHDTVNVGLQFLI